MSEEQAREVVEFVRGRFPDSVLSWSTSLDESTIVVSLDKWIPLAKWLAADGGFHFLSDLCAVDWPRQDPRFEIVYNLTDMRNVRRLRAKVAIPGDPPKAPSVTAIWPTANWHEREVYDMFGIIFEGHADLRRILMPDEWEGHPLRKDYSMGKVPIEYKSISPGF